MVLAFGLVGVGVAFSQEAPQQSFYTAKDIHDWWFAYERQNLGTAQGADAYYSGKYVAFVSGVLDTMLSLQVLAVPAHISIAEVCAVVGNYLDNHPEEWTHAASAPVIEALWTAYGKPGR